jgi:hypothetical protein
MTLVMRVGTLAVRVVVAVAVRAVALVLRGRWP